MSRAMPLTEEGSSRHSTNAKGLSAFDADHESDADLRDTAELLYQNGIVVPFLTCIAGAFMLVVMPSARVQAGWAIAGWFTALLLVAVIRAVDFVTYARRRTVPGWTGRAELRRYGFGTVATGLVWAAFPVAFFHLLTIVERTTMAITLSALAGGSLAIIGAVPWLEIAFSACMLLPGSAMFYLTPGGENAIIATGGLMYFGFVVSQTAVIHRSTTSAIRTSRANQQLQAALSESLETLEERIKARTADLEREVLERDRYGRELARYALRDSLTGLYNRHTLADQLASEIELAGAAGASVAVLFLDLDRFKDVNDLLGHHAGDLVLQEVAQRLSGAVPPEAILARWGGDEFVFAQRLTDASATDIGERFRRAVAEPIVLAGETVAVGATIGIALFPHHGSSADELIRAADMAMYAAKQDGHDRVRTYDPSLADELGKRHHLEHALRDAIVNEALRLEYQPIVDATSGRWTALEALLRWDSITYGSVPPSEFIPLAERTGDINVIGRWVLERACADAVAWTPAVPVSVNVSVAQIVAGTLVDQVRHALERTGLAPSCLHIEVTESLFAGDHEQTIPTLEALRALGVRILLDDFGTGFSSLGYLRALPIDAIKIDKSFIDGIAGESRAIVEAIRTLASAFHLAVIAEGVETSDQVAALLTLGITELQGFYYSRPVRPDAVLGMLVAGV
jgi:diguanylate cyclase (GGDEF)-like protein